MNEVRIIGGIWRSRRIRFVARPGLRPTPDRVRETLFNWLGQDLTGLRCLDLFAGSGALGFEAASRGAKAVVLVEHDGRSHAALQAARTLLSASQVEVVRRDALEFVRRDTQTYDVIFLDPPFSEDWWPRLSGELPRVLAPEGFVYLEYGGEVVPGDAWQVVRSGHAGQVHYYLMKRNSA